MPPKKRGRRQIQTEVEDGKKEDKTLRVTLNRDKDIEKLVTEKLKEEDKPATKGKRGRSKVTDSEDENAKSPKAFKTEETEELSEGNKKLDNRPAPKGKRGRPKVVNSIENTTESDVVLENNKNSNEKPVPKGKRGRPKAADSKSDNTDSPNVSECADSNEQSEVLPDVLENKDNDDKPAPKGKRGRNKVTESNDDSAKPPKMSKKTESKGQSRKDKMPDVTQLDFSNSSVSTSNKSWNFKLSSWNVNGIRALLEKDGLSYIKHESPDILCVQETKCSDDKLPEEVNVSGYHCYWLAGDQEGYSGVGLLSKIKPISIKYGIDVEDHDKEGRVITAEYERFFLVTAYVPNAGRKLVRLDYRMQWDKDFLNYLKKLDSKKPVILCGDLNVAHEEIDLANPKTNKRNAGFTKEEREGFSTLLKEGFIDTFRHLYPEKKNAYTFWTYMMNARAKDVGWRLDYFVMSERFTEHLCDSVIRKEVMGSDHCPITLFLSV